MRNTSLYSYQNRSYSHPVQRSSAREPYSIPRSRYTSSYVFRPRKRRLKPVITVLILVIALGVFAAGNVVNSYEPLAITRASLAPTSTPVGEWHKGEVPSLYQIDPEWSQEPYAGDTIEQNGCGPLCLTMVYIACTGKKDYDPVRMCALSEQQDFVYDGATKWSFMTEGAALLGLSSREVPASEEALLAELEADHPVIAIMGPGDFTEKGHFIVLSGVTDQGEVVVRDPNSVENTSRTWDVQTLLRQMRGMWAFSSEY